MELDESISLWRGRATDASLIGGSTCVGKDGNRLVLLTSAEDVREICAPTRKCVNHWTFRANSGHALHVPAVRHPHSRIYFGICEAPGVSASKKARQARRQEANKTTVLPATQGITMWHDTDSDVATWRRAPLQSNSKVFAMLAHVKLKEEVVVVFQDGSFATYDEELKRGVHVHDALESTKDDGEDGENKQIKVVWAFLETEGHSSLKGGLFLSILMQKTTQKRENYLVLMVYQITSPALSRRKGGVLSVDQRVRQRISLPDNQELSSCAFHPDSFSYTLVGRLGCWYSLRFSRDASTNEVTLVASQQLSNLLLTDTIAKTPVHKKRKLQADSQSSLGYLVGGVGHASFLVSLSLDAPLAITAWDSKFAVPVSKKEINVATDKGNEDKVLVRCNSNHGVGKAVQIVHVGAGDAIIVVFERSAFLFHVKNKTSTLASVLGATAFHDLTSSETSAMPDSCVQWENVAVTSSDMLDANTWKSNMCSEDEQERQLISELLDPQTTATAAQFISRLNKALKDRERKRKTGPEYQEELSYRLIQAVTQRCLESSDLGLWEPLEKMLRTKRLSARAEPTLLPTLMKHHQFALLECAIVHLIDIDERSIVRLLKYFVRQSTTSSLIEFVTKQVTNNKKKETGNVDDITAIERYTVALLSLPTNGVFLHRAVRELELEEVLLVLAICKKLLLVHTTGDDADDSETTTNASEKGTDSKTTVDKVLAVKKNDRRFTPLPSAAQCCSWICVLLDAHLAALVQRASQNSEISSALHQLDELVQLVLCTNAQYESVHGVLSNFLSGVELPQAPGLADYCIEELCL